MSNEQERKEVELNRAILVASLDLLCELADARGLWENGRLEAAFAELGAMFPEKA